MVAVNYLIINALRKYYQYYGESHTYEFPAKSGNKLNLKHIANQLTKRLLKIYNIDENGKFHYHDSKQLCWKQNIQGNITCSVNFFRRYR